MAFGHGFWSALLRAWWREEVAASLEVRPGDLTHTASPLYERNWKNVRMGYDGHSSPFFIVALQVLPLNDIPPIYHKKTALN